MGQLSATATCYVCGNPLDPRSRGAACSTGCNQKAYRLRKQGLMPIRPALIGACVVCGAEVRAVHGQPAKVCSTACKARYYRDVDGAVEAAPRVFKTDIRPVFPNSGPAARLRQLSDLIGDLDMLVSRAKALCRGSGEGSLHDVLDEAVDYAQEVCTALADTVEAAKVVAA